MMRLLVVLGALAAIQVVDARPSRADQGYYDGPWCAQFWGGDTQYKNCSMRSFEMCLNEIRGTGGNTLCSPNPYYRPSRVEPAPRRKHSG
jgi:hypothetical protein